MIRKSELSICRHTLQVVVLYNLQRSGTSITSTLSLLMDGSIACELWSVVLGDIESWEWHVEASKMNVCINDLHSGKTRADGCLLIPYKGEGLTFYAHLLQ